jgi:hypothetical protein
VRSCANLSAPRVREHLRPHPDTVSVLVLSHATRRNLARLARCLGTVVHHPRRGGRRFTRAADAARLSIRRTAARLGQVWAADRTSTATTILSGCAGRLTDSAVGAASGRRSRLRRLQRASGHSRPTQNRSTLRGPATSCGYRAGSKSSIGLPSGSSIWTCRPTGPASI